MTSAPPSREAGSMVTFKQNSYQDRRCTPSGTDHNLRWELCLRHSAGQLQSRGQPCRFSCGPTGDRCGSNFIRESRRYTLTPPLRHAASKGGKSRRGLRKAKLKRKITQRREDHTVVGSAVCDLFPEGQQISGNKANSNMGAEGVAKSLEPVVRFEGGPRSSLLRCGHCQTFL